VFGPNTEPSSGYEIKVLKEGKLAYQIYTSLKNYGKLVNTLLCCAI
jgi:hypothetical protein